MAELRAIVGYAFKNHGQFRIQFDQNICITGLNGSGKTNILEAIYFGINGILPPDRSIESTINHSSESGFIKMIYTDQNDIEFETVTSLDGTKKKIQFTLQGAATTRQKVLAKHGRRAILFSPMDMNLVYLSPSLRRNFLDEILLLSYSEFQQIRKKYTSTLKSRNALLKRFAKFGGDRNEMKIWDTLFIEQCNQYQKYRDELLIHLQETLKKKEATIRKGIELQLRFSSDFSNTSPSDRENFLKTYLETNLERDILVGHTCIGPHLDDLEIEATSGKTSYPCSQLLSRGENKTLLLHLKESGARFIEDISGATAYFLLDDIESELDEHHFKDIISQMGPKSFSLAGIELPKYLSSDTITHICVPKNGFQGASNGN